MLPGVITIYWLSFLLDAVDDIEDICRVDNTIEVGIATFYSNVAFLSVVSSDDQKIKGIYHLIKIHITLLAQVDSFE